MDELFFHIGIDNALLLHRHGLWLTACTSPDVTLPRKRLPGTTLSVGTAASRLYAYLNAECNVVHASEPVFVALLHVRRLPLRSASNFHSIATICFGLRVTVVRDVLYMSVSGGTHSGSSLCLTMELHACSKLPTLMSPPKPLRISTHPSASFHTSVNKNVGAPSPFPSSSKFQVLSPSDSETPLDHRRSSLFELNSGCSC